MSEMSIKWKQLSKYMSSKVLKVIECLECKRPLSTNQMIRVQSIQIEICKQKYNQVREYCSIWFYLFLLS